MKEQLIKAKSKTKMVIYMFLILAILLGVVFGTKILPSISLGADVAKISVESKLDKYINYNISDQDKGTLVQYDVKSKIEYGENFYPVENSEILVHLSQIDGKYPYAVKAIAKSTEATNGKTTGIEENYEYDATTGKLILRASNQNEEGEIIYQEQPNQNATDEYLIICYYDTYVEENPERYLAIEMTAKATLSTEDSVTINGNALFETNVTESIGNMTSISYETEDIYNGYIKSNKINGTNYNTQYKETEEILISKKEAQENIELSESNTFENSGEDSIIYKSTKISKENITEILGEDGVVEILDKDQQVIATIDKNTEFAEDGTYTINYENEPQEITIRTSQVKNEGILTIENTKEIKSTMTDLQNTKIKTTTQINGIEEQNIVDIKDSQTNITMNVSSVEWDNKQQNEVTFDIYLNSNTIENNLLKNPQLKIKLPNEVEKVILGNSSIVYANGLELQEPYTETDENGNINIIANLSGTQTAYTENSADLITNIKISATVILKKDIENTTGNVDLVYTNQYTVDGTTETGNKNIEIQIKSYEEEKAPTVAEPDVVYDVATTSVEEIENIEGLQVQVAPIRGDVSLANEDTVYEGEYIKYNIKVTNNADKELGNIKITGTVPEGATYGELQAEYYEPLGEYKYNFDETIKSKDIEIGTLQPGESINVFYEVQVNDLAEGETEKEITTNIKAYVGEQEASNYEIKNTVKPADVKVFLGSELDNLRDKWNYNIYLTSEVSKQETVQIKLPKEYTPQILVSNSDKVDIDPTQISSENVLTLTLNTNVQYSVQGMMDSSGIVEETENSKVELTAIATVISDNMYKSNENRIIYSYETATITMTSDNEGEELRYGDEIEYNITITNTGRTNLNDPSYSSISVNVKDFLPQEVNPVSITYEDWTEQRTIINEETGAYTTEGKFDKEEKLQEITEIQKNENGEQLANVDLNLTIPYAESVNIKVKATAGMVYEKTKIENSATVTGTRINDKTSNTITNTILPYDYEETTDPINPNDPNEPIVEGKSNISGVVWNDENEDGQRQSTEKLEAGVKVLLIDAQTGEIVKDQSGKEFTTTTDSNGAYNFEQVENGKYLVIFEYNQDKYSITEYQVNGVSSNLNSDVTSKKMTLQGNEVIVGATDIITLNSSKSNIDMGLIENKISDLKLDKYISKVVVSTKNGTKEQTYDNSKLAKVEIKAKEIEGATVVIEYKIVITNEGEIPTTVGKVTDYLPEGLTFSSELNTNWTATKNGEIINTSTSNQKIQPGESIELTLVATKSMTANGTGTFTNAAEIAETSNQSGIADRDSTPGNKQESEDDISQADIIIAVSTGAIVYVSIAIVGVVILGIIAFVLYKKNILKINKIALFGIILVGMIIFQNTNVLSAYQLGKNLETTQFYNSDQGTNFTGGPDGKGGICIENGVWAYSGGYSYSWYSETSTKVTTHTDDISIKLTKQNDVIEMKSLGSNYYIFGPFKVKSTYNAPYTYEVLDKNGAKISGYVPCDKNGKEKTVSGTDTFYLKIPVENCKNGVSKVKISATRTGKKTTVTEKHGKIVYKYNGELNNGTRSQDVKTKSIFKVWTETKEERISNTASVEWTNINGALEIVKQDADNPDIKLEGVEIRVQCKEINYDETFTTDKNGRIYIENLPSGHVYALTEISNKNYGYEATATGNIKIKSGMPQNYTMVNQRKYVKLSGYVWVDNIDIGKTSEKDALFNDSDYSSEDVLKNGVIVRLKDKTTGKTVKDENGNDMETVTSSLGRYKNEKGHETGAGEYLFEDVLCQDLKDNKYYIEFEYNGLTYTSVTPAYIDKNNGSKAIEKEEDRDAFNNGFSSVEGETRNTGITRDASGKETNQLTYEVNEDAHTSTLISTDTQYPITANTDKTGYKLSEHYNGEEEVKYINLGLTEREQPDIALMKDIQNVRLTVNGYEHTYNYAQRFNNANEYGDGFNVGVKFGSKYGSMSYTRPIYEADYTYINENDKDKELKAYITYAITMKNQSSNLKVKVNSIVDYYDTRYNSDNVEQIPVKVGTILDEKGNVGTQLDANGNATGTLEYEETAYNQNYTKMVINTNTEIEHQEQATIYVQFALNREAVLNILNDKENLENVAEINSYSVYDGEKIYAGIDTDSNPGNCVPGDKKTYEDDTDSSPGLTLEVTDAREISGKVFLDSTGEALMTGEIRQGSGTYEEGEKGIEGVEITLKENSGSGKVYTTKTDADGNFLITGYIPGDYTLTYTWGDETYTVQDYKGTVYDQSRYEANMQNGNWYKENIDARLTDAVDNYDTNQDAPKGSRKQIDEEMGTGNTTRTKMDSTTPTMKIGVEFETTYTASAGDKYTYRIQNVDFGIVERARQKLDISKKATGIKITLANGQVLIDAKIVDGKLEGDLIKGLTYMGPSNNSNGFVKAEIDNELIHGSNIQIEYTIEVVNKGEKDYNSEEYYKYGIQTGDIIKITPTGVYDYLDNEMTLDKKEENSQWKIVSTEEYNNIYESSTLLETYFKDGKITETLPDGTIKETYVWETSDSTQKMIFEEWASETTEQRTVRDVKLSDKTILNNEQLEKELAPNESNTVKLYTTKMLANSDEIDLNNEVEITEMKRTQNAGRLPEVSNSVLYAQGETVIVTPATGENQNYIIPILTGVIASIILGAGVVIIKKKVI